MQAMDMRTANQALDISEAELRRTLPKHAVLRVELRQRLQRLRTGDALPTIASLRAEYGVSLATVDRALRELRQEGVIEVRHGSGIYATGRSHVMNVGLYFSFDLLAPQIGVFPRLLLQGLHEQAGNLAGLQLRHYLSVGDGSPWNARADTLAGDVRRHLVDGIIMVALYGGEFADLPVPVVALGALPQATHRVDLDYAAMVRQAVGVLRRRGCRRLAYLGHNPAELPDPDHFAYGEALRSRGVAAVFRREAAKCQVVTHPEWLCGSGVSGLPDVVKQGHDSFCALWTARRDRPDGIVSVDDYLTAGALAAMRELGVAPGRDVHLVSHANTGSDLLAGEPVTRIEFEAASVARALLTAVTSLITGHPRVPKTILVPPHDIVACACAKDP